MKRILIIYPNAFPTSGAATNRIIAISKALVSQGALVKVIITRPTEDIKSVKNFKKQGSFEGIHFEYALNQMIWPKNKLHRAYFHYLGLFVTFAKIVRSRKTTNYNNIITAASYSFLYNFLFKIASLIVKANYFHTIDEYPIFVRSPSKFKSSYIYKWIYLNYFFKMFDGYIIMTKTLVNYYTRYIIDKNKIIHIPMTVELERFSPKVIGNINVENRITYLGNDPKGKKDGVDILVKAFCLIARKYPDIKLTIVGNVHCKVKTEANLSPFSKRIHFIHSLSRENVPTYLAASRVLCLSRPNNKQAEGGFPTKLGEYLASGRPVVITNVGEIKEYLVNNQNSIIADNDTPEEFASRLDYAMNNEDIANEIGVRGKETAFKEFNYQNYSKQLYEFLFKKT